MNIGSDLGRAWFTNLILWWGLSVALVFTLTILFSVIL
jgi:hypothetical protein